MLDRPQLTKPVDTNYWRSETDFRLYANECYPNYFVGYNNTWGVDYAPLRGYYFSDDNAWAGKQSVMENAVPSSRGSSSLSTGSDLWLTKYGSATWNFAWVRKINTMIDRLDMYGKVNLTEEAYNHWMGLPASSGHSNIIVWSGLLETSPILIRFFWRQTQLKCIKTGRRELKSWRKFMMI